MLQRGLGEILRTKSFMAKPDDNDGYDYESSSVAAMCAVVQSRGGGKVTARPGFEDALAEEIRRRSERFEGIWTQIGEGRWLFSLSELRIANE